MKLKNNPLAYSKMFRFGSIFLLLVVSLTAPGCTISKRGMMGDNLYFSNQSPSIKVSVNKDFVYQKGKRGEFQHQFIDGEKHKGVYIHHVLQDPNGTQVDYYNNPEHWIYSSSSDFVEIDRFAKNFIGEKWYIQDYVNHVSTSACFLTRKFSTFTSMYDVFHILYFWEMPPYKCKDWISVESLSDTQQLYIEDFRKGFSGDLKIEKYVKK